MTFFLSNSLITFFFFPSKNDVIMVTGTMTLLYVMYDLLSVVMRLDDAKNQQLSSSSMLIDDGVRFVSESNL